MLEFRLTSRLTPEARSDIKKVSGFFKRVLGKVKADINSFKDSFQSEVPYFEIPIPSIQFNPEPPETWHDRLSKAKPEARDKAVEVLKQNEQYLNNPAYAPLIARRVSEVSPLVEAKTLSQDYSMLIKESEKSAELFETLSPYSPERIVAQMQRQAQSFQPFNFETLDIKKMAIGTQIA